MDTTSGTVVYRTTNASIREFGAIDYCNLTVDGITADLASDITVAGNLALANNATLNLNGHTLTVQGDLTGTGTVAVGSGTLVVKGNLTVSTPVRHERDHPGCADIQPRQLYGRDRHGGVHRSRLERGDPGHSNLQHPEDRHAGQDRALPERDDADGGELHRHRRDRAARSACGATADGSQWTITPTTASVSYAFVKDSTANAVIIREQQHGRDGNNVNWHFNSAGQLHHFAISAVTSPQTAGVPFPITITAQDVSNATVAGFTGTVTISDRTGTIIPAVSGNFVAGVRTETVMISAVATNVTIVVSNGTIQGQSTAFDVQAYAPFTGLIGYWKFDEGSGTTAIDSSVSSNPGTLIKRSDVDGRASWGAP